MDTSVFTFVGVAIFAIILIWLTRQRFSIEKLVGVHDFASIARALQTTGSDGAFAAFVLNPEKRGARNTLNLQLSKEGGVVGFDWVLLADLNIHDKDRVEEFSRSRGIAFEARCMNGVDYLRTEADGYVDLLAAIITEMYGCGDDTKIILIQDGFEWEANAA
ncbi:MAG: hypothetical protein Tsb0027_19320 [Wenzhouxiangellaceae bacterium]